MTLDYKKVKERMDRISPTYCAAKWLTSTIWLYCGESVSCHHVEGGKRISLSKLAKDVKGLHNTCNKVVARQEMLEGKKTKECKYCWAIENTGDYAGDRLYKTAEFSEEDIANTLEDLVNINPKYLEIAFDNICNFACCYCQPKYSSKWKKFSEDKTNYTFLKGAYAFYFWKWFPDLMKNKTTIRVTGGEPLLHSEFWKLLDIYENEKIETPLMVNTNLGSSDELISKLIAKSKNIKDMTLHTSCEAIGERAEYIRDGMDFKKFESNLIKVIKSGSFKIVNIMATLTNLSVCHYTEFLDWVLYLKKSTNSDNHPSVTTNLLHHPSFMGVNVLPKDKKEEAVNSLEKWFNENKGSIYFDEVELETVEKLINYMKEDVSDKRDLLRDFQVFFKNYDKVRGKNLSLFPKMVGWHEDK